MIFRLYLKLWTLSRAKIVQFTSDKDTAYSYYSKGVYYVVVNPTDNAREWLENLLFLFKQKKKRKDFGFVAYSYRNAGEDFYPQIKEKYNGVSPIHFVGASRGGAISLYLYLAFQRDFPNTVMHLFTFGCPPAGKQELVDYCESINMIHTRIVNQNDCVPHIPRKGKHYESTLVKLTNNRRQNLPFWKRGFTLCKESHLGYGTELQREVILREKLLK